MEIPLARAQALATLCIRRGAAIKSKKEKSSTWGHARAIKHYKVNEPTSMSNNSLDLLFFAVNHNKQQRILTVNKVWGTRRCLRFRKVYRLFCTFDFSRLNTFFERLLDFSWQKKMGNLKYKQNNSYMFLNLRQLYIQRMRTTFSQLWI